MAIPFLDVTGFPVVVVVVVTVPAILASSLMLTLWVALSIANLVRFTVQEYGALS